MTEHPKKTRRKKRGNEIKNTALLISDLTIWILRFKKPNHPSLIFSGKIEREKKGERKNTLVAPN